MSLFLLLSFAAAQPSEWPTCPPAPDPVDCDDGAARPSDIVVTASLAPVRRDAAPASVTLLAGDEIARLGLPQASDLIRLAPGASVSTSGGPGSLTQVRIRGAEANHTLVFIDGIAFNDLAAGNQARFETFAADGLGRLELVRGPQSALWGSEALGGVIAMASPAPLGAFRAAALGEYGGRDTLRVSAAVASGGVRTGVTATAGFSRDAGIDVLGGGRGDRDGYENLTFGARGAARLGDAFDLGAAARYIRHDVAFDGSDPVTFARADTADASIAETVAGRVWVNYGGADTPWQARIEAQHLDSDNRNRTGNVRSNDSYGRRSRFGGQLSRRLAIGATRHLLIAAAEREEERFGTRDLRFGGASDRDLGRARTAVVGEWRGEWGGRLVTDVALRYDDFSRFEDATTLRVHGELKLGGGLSLVAGYGEGIAQPGFVDLFGFGPGSGFVANPDLRPERSEGYDVGLRWSRARFAIEAVAFSNDLADEIVEDFSAFPGYTVVNAPGTSRRRGLELSGEWRPFPGLSLGANYTWLDSREPDAAALREVRRPEHSANLYGSWQSERLTIGAAISYVGARVDRDFDLFPAPRVKLGAYVLASARAAYRLTDQLEAFARVENGFDESYQDVVGYATPGRSVHAGVRLALGD